MNTKTPQGGWPISDLARNVNDPEVVAELQRLYALYEAALVANHVETLTRMFWASPQASGSFSLWASLNASSTESVAEFGFKRAGRLGNAP